MCFFVCVFYIYIYISALMHRLWRSRKHLCKKVTPDLHLTFSKKGGNLGVGIKMIKNGNYLYFSIKSYVVDVY